MRSSEIVDVTRENAHAIKQIAELLMEGFRDASPTSWRTIVEAITAFKQPK